MSFQGGDPTGCLIDGSRSPSVLGKNDPFLLGYSDPPEVPRLRPQTKGTEGDIIPAGGRLLGSGFVSKVGSFLPSTEGDHILKLVVVY